MNRAIGSLFTKKSGRPDAPIGLTRRTLPASGQDFGVALSHLTVEIMHMSFNVGDTWTMISDRTLGLVRPIDQTRAFGHPELGCSESLMALFR